MFLWLVESAVQIREEIKKWIILFRCAYIDIVFANGLNCVDCFQNEQSNVYRTVGSGMF